MKKKRKNNLKTTAIDAGYRLNELANSLNISEKVIYAYSGGYRAINNSHLEKICNFLNCNSTDILGF